MSDQMKALASAYGCIEEYTKDLQNRITEARGYFEEQKIAIDFVNEFPEPMASVNEYLYSMQETRVQITLDTGTVKALLVNKDYKKLEDVKVHLRWLTQRLGKYEIEDTPEINRRAYVFRGGRFRFQAFFPNTEADACKWVKTGTKEVDVFELQCGGKKAEDTPEEVPVV